MMPQIKFSENWNRKLDNYIFTTVRKFTEEKYKYYQDQIDKHFEVMLEGNVIGFAKLIEVEKRNFLDVGRTMLRLDTGIISGDAIMRLFDEFGIKQNDKVIILTFTRNV